MSDSKTTAKVRELNDLFRKTGRGGRIMLTQGIQALGQQTVMETMAKVRAFDKFTKDNDPYGEHDFGKIVHGHETVFFKLDYYDKALVSAGVVLGKNSTRIPKPMITDRANRAPGTTILWDAAGR